MKRLLLALLALAASLPALADGVEPLPMGSVLAVDLDGDGVNESVRWEMVPDEYDEHLTLTILSGDGMGLAYDTDILWGEAAYVLDLDGDGIQEIFLTGDVMSDDYYTYCLRYEGGALYEVLFPDCDRSEENTDGYFKTGYGRITAIGNGSVTLSGSQDVLGTWFASRTLALSPYSRFEFDDDGLWLRDLSGVEEDDLWEYQALTLTASLPYADLQGNPAGVLSPGTKLLVYATDKRETVRFSTSDGVTGMLTISPDYERGWGFLVEGLPEEECFEMVPYAD